jgi:eukaryotic-like serine/threonine-protein kinase
MNDEDTPLDRPEIPGYRLLDLLGEGGCAKVWLAEETVSGRKAAVKILSESAPEEERARMRGWEDAVRLVRHPNLTRVLGLGEAGGRPYLIMEYVRGRTLDERVSVDGPLSEAEALDLALEVARGLREASRSGLVHGDVKPGNLLIDGKGRVRVCDLGFAKPGAERVGTPFYMAPEQIRGGAEIDARADMYALGLTMYFAVTGDLPFAGEDVRGVLRLQLESPLSDPRTKRAGITAGFVRVISRMAAKDRDTRYPDWTALIDDLESMRDDAGAVVRATRIMSRFANRPLIRAAFLITIVAAVVSLAVLAFRDGGGGDESAERARLAAEAEAEARGALEQLDRELARGESDAIDEFRRLRELVRRYPGTRAAQEALARARVLEKHLTRLREERCNTAMLLARDLERECRYDRALRTLEEQRRILSGTELASKLDFERARVLGTARAKLAEVEQEVADLVTAGKHEEALVVLKNAPREQAGGLRDWIDQKQAFVELLLDR